MSVSEIELDVVAADLGYYARVAYESGDRVPADAMKSLLTLALDLRDALARVQRIDPREKR